MQIHTLVILNNVLTEVKPGGEWPSGDWPRPVLVCTQNFGRFCQLNRVTDYLVCTHVALSKIRRFNWSTIWSKTHLLCVLDFRNLIIVSTWGYVCWQLFKMIGSLNRTILVMLSQSHFVVGYIKWRTQDNKKRDIYRIKHYFLLYFFVCC